LFIYLGLKGTLTLQIWYIWDPYYSLFT